MTEPHNEMMPGRDPTADFDEAAAAWLEGAQTRLATDPRLLPELLVQLPRRVGRDLLDAEPMDADGCLVDLRAWRFCDLAAYTMLQQAEPTTAQIIDLFQRGDLEERTMLLRCLSVRPIDDATIALLAEAQRTNMQVHFEAAICDSNLLARTLEAGRSDFGQPDFNRMLLKVAFVDLPLDRVSGAERHANVELSRMLHGLSTERQAAGRKVWEDTDRLIAQAPLDAGNHQA